MYETLVPTSEETETEYWQSVEPEGTPLLLRYKKDKNVIENPAPIQARVSPRRQATPPPREHVITQVYTRRGTERHAEQNPHNTSFTWNQRHLWTNEICQNVHDRIRNDDDLIDRIGQSTYTCMRRDTSFFEEIAGYAARSFKNQMADILPGFMDYMMQRRMTPEGQFQVSLFILKYMNFILTIYLLTLKNYNFCHTTKDPHFTTPVEEQANNAHFTTPIEERANDIPFTTPVEEQTNDPSFTTPVQEMEVQNYDDLEDEDPIWSQAVRVAEATARADINYIAPSWQRPQIDNERTTYPPKLDFTVVRARAASAVLRSPFRPYDKRGVEYQKFLKSKMK